MFNRCDFLYSKKNSNVVIAIPAELPEAETYTVSISQKEIRFKAGHNEIVTLPYKSDTVFEKIAGNIQVGLLEYTSADMMPNHITKMAYVEVRQTRH